MGNKKARLQAFIRKHPMCCFCGGNSPTETRDHLPPRSVFLERKTPEEYEFPACTKCNNHSAVDDAIFGLIARLRIDQEPSEEEAAEFNKVSRAFVERWPKDAREMLLTANEKRRILQKDNVALPPEGTYGDLPLIKLTSRVKDAIQSVSKRLMRALHYKHSGRIVPATADVSVFLFPNYQHLTKRFPVEILDLVNGYAELRRENIALNDQFSYRFGVSDDGSLGAYVAGFRTSFLVAGTICFDAAIAQQVEAELRNLESSRQTAS